MLRLSSPKVQVEFFGHDKTRVEPWIFCLKNLGAQVDFKFLTTSKDLEDDLTLKTDIAVFSGDDNFLRSKNLADLCTALKEEGVFVVVIYQTDKQLHEMKSVGVQPNWIIPIRCTDHDRLSLSHDILDTVRFVKWSKSLSLNSSEVAKNE